MKNNYIRIHGLVPITGLCRSQIYKLMQKGLFPKSYKLSERAVGWKSEEVENWIESRVQSNEGGE